MLNYIWAGLIGLSLFFAITKDVLDVVNNTYKNGESYKIELKLIDGNEGDQTQKAWLFYESGDSVLVNYKPSYKEITITDISSVPAHWKLVHQLSKKSDSEPLRVQVASFNQNNSEAFIVLPKVVLVKIRAIAAAAFDMAEFAVKLAISLIGTMALWLGLMQIAEKSGLIQIFVRFVQPVLGYLFPSVPKNHPALAAISLNLTANMLGLSNAATPLGIKAMEELQKINPKKDTATDAMCMFLTINTASVTVIPPVTLVAVMGVGVSELILSIIIATGISLTVGIIAAKWLQKRHPEKNSSVILTEEV